MNSATFLSDRVCIYKRNLMISSTVFLLAALSQDVTSIFKYVGFGADFGVKANLLAFQLMAVQMYFVLQFALPAIAEQIEHKRQMKQELDSRGRVPDGYCRVAESSRHLEVATPILYGILGILASHYLWWIS